MVRIPFPPAASQAKRPLTPAAPRGVARHRLPNLAGRVAFALVTERDVVWRRSRTDRHRRMICDSTWPPAEEQGPERRRANAPGDRMVDIDAIGCEVDREYNGRRLPLDAADRPCTRDVQGNPSRFIEDRARNEVSDLYHTKRLPPYASVLYIGVLSLIGWAGILALVLLFV
jgi:hypothetical protein